MKDVGMFLFVLLMYIFYFSLPTLTSSITETEVVSVKRKVNNINIEVCKDTTVSHKLLATKYNAVEAQCDSDPLITADNSKINLKHLNKNNLRWVAVSRDMLKYYPYGTVILIECENNKLNGYWEVHDTMNKRFNKRIDFLVPEDDNLDFDKPIEVKITKVN